MTLQNQIVEIIRAELPSHHVVRALNSVTKLQSEFDRNGTGKSYLKIVDLGREISLKLVAEIGIQTFYEGDYALLDGLRAPCQVGRVL